MPLAQVILQGTGPLPLKGSFNFESTLPANIMVSATAWSVQPNMEISINLSIDGTAVAGAQLFANETNSHKALVSALAPVNLAFGSHDVELDVTSSPTTTDANDYFTVTLIY